MFIFNLKSYTNTMLLALLIICLPILYFFMTKKPYYKVYLIEFACYKPPDSQKCPKKLAMTIARTSGYLSEKTLDFMQKTLERSGLGDSTYAPEFNLKAKTYNPSIKDSRREVEMVVFGSIDLLLAKTGVRCEHIGIVIVNCTIYNTVPSLSSTIVNRYKLRENVISYNLVGMGCAAGLLAIGLANRLLQIWSLWFAIMARFSSCTSLLALAVPVVHEDRYALIVSTESLTENCYIGNEQSKFLINCLFRVGGAAVLLSNRPSDHRSSKYRILHTVHNNTTSSDLSYNCIFREEDKAGIVGINTDKYLLAAAVATIKPNLAALGRLILPPNEKLRYLINYIARKLLPTAIVRPYIPNYATAVEHFLPHVGGKMVLDELQRTLQFSDTVMEASRMTLYRYGNTSSSSIWYELAYVEAKGRVKKGDRVWQIAFGSGFKCCSVVWRAMRTVDHDDKNPWTDEIDGFPVTLDECEPMPVFFEPTD